MLVDILGDYPQIRVFDYLLLNPFGEYTKQQIAVGAEISRFTLNKFIGDLFNKNVLLKSSNSKFKLNLKSPIIKKLNLVLDELNDKELSEQMNNLNEDYDKLSDDQLDKIFDENAPDVDLNQLEKEITLKESYFFHICR